MLERALPLLYVFSLIKIIGEICFIKRRLDTHFNRFCQLKVSQAFPLWKGIYLSQSLFMLSIIVFNSGFTCTNCNLKLMKHQRVSETNIISNSLLSNGALIHSLCLHSLRSKIFPLIIIQTYSFALKSWFFPTFTCINTLRL